MNFKRLQDINLEDAILKQEYYNLMFNGNIDSARQILADNQQLSTKVINAENLNILIDNILELEGLYHTNVTDFLANELSEFQINIDELVYMKNFNSSEQYVINNFVLYNEEVYYCYEQAPIGTLPTNTTYWVYLGLKGEKGSPTLGVCYQGEWVEENNYLKNDMVQYSNQLFVARVDSKGVDPTDNTKWLLAVKIEPLGIHISETEPSGLRVGDVWIKLKK